MLLSLTGPPYGVWTNNPPLPCAQLSMRESGLIRPLLLVCSTGVRAACCIEQIYQLQFTIGFTLEFHLVESNDALGAGKTSSSTVDARLRSDAASSSSAAVMHGQRDTCIEECVRALQLCGIAIEQFHAENWGEYFRISTEPMWIVQSADALVQSQQIVQRVHARISFERRDIQDGENVGYRVENGQFKIGYHFLARILARIPTLCAFGMPSIESYNRVRPGGTGEWCAWSSGDRDVPVKAISPQHFELRTIDGTANIYLAPAAHVAAGVLGIANREPLTSKDCREVVHNLSKEEWHQYGITTQIPKHLCLGLIHLRKDQGGLKSVIGSRMWQFYYTVKDAELCSFQG
ncbi:hypothetical protein AJ79_04635 [Helicocarpus griseus UAMH5409]|uniref:GS catalytic domain-containing protein n=1 Tax=Helicocarpus griseus UAMH5409 TaxID=1447875 RepID=A0A2B7XTC4_9EURO|nr:hypothetical protein AJ79_04635 [Helicocarpus griseus UAMH5409]